jgi:hypothetical protein
MLLSPFYRRGLFRFVPDGGRGVALVAILLSAIIAPNAVAHHSAAMYDDKQEVTYEGTVAEYQWGNPHTFLILNVQTKGGMVRHIFEAPAPSYLKRYGWGFSSIKQGEHVKVACNPLRPGRSGGPGGQLLDVTFSDGRKLDAHQRLGHYKFEKDGGLVIDRFSDESKSGASKK